MSKFEFLRKAELVKLMTTMGIVEKYENEWYMTRRFKEFVKNCKEKILDMYAAVLRIDPELDEFLTALSLMLREWDPEMPTKDMIEVTMFLDYWITYGVCPFDRYGDIRQEWL